MIYILNIFILLQSLSYIKCPPSDFPPSTNNVCPVIKCVFGEAKKATALAIKSGEAALPDGSNVSHSANISGGADRVIGVSVKPGAIEFTEICTERNSMAMARVNPITAALEAT